MDNLQIKPISKEIKLPSNIEAEQTLIALVFLIIINKRLEAINIKHQMNMRVVIE